MSRDLITPEIHLPPKGASFEVPSVVRANERLAIQAWEELADKHDRSRRRAWWLTCGLIGVVAIQAGAIAFMLPLKDVVPYTLLVDRTTGYVETVKGVDVGPLGGDRALTEAFLAQYVIARETFDVTDLADRYSRVALWSTGEAQSDYFADYKKENPDGILAQVNASTRIHITVKQVELTAPGTARVRFAATRREIDGAETIGDWSSLVTFRYTGAPMRMEDRLINPLGFQAVTYRRDLEGAPVASIAPQSAPQVAVPVGPAPMIVPGTGMGGPEDLVIDPRTGSPVEGAPPVPAAQPQIQSIPEPPDIRGRNSAPIPIPIPLPTQAPKREKPPA
jgi:type IV secretion system protein VirB8